jgi:hypothetical protein
MLNTVAQLWSRHAFNISIKLEAILDGQTKVPKQYTRVAKQHELKIESIF